MMNEREIALTIGIIGMIMMLISTILSLHYELKNRYNEVIL